MGVVVLLGLVAVLIILAIVVAGVSATAWLAVWAFGGKRYEVLLGFAVGLVAEVGVVYSLFPSDGEFAVRLRLVMWAPVGMAVGGLAAAGVTTLARGIARRCEPRLADESSHTSAGQHGCPGGSEGQQS